MPINQKFTSIVALTFVLILTQGCTTMNSWYTNSKNFIMGEDDVAPVSTMIAKPAPPPAPPPPPPVVVKLEPPPKKMSPPKVIRTEDIKLSGLDLKKFAYELGYDPRKELTLEQKMNIMNRKKLRQLERSLDTQKERLQYSKVLPWLEGDEEKIEMLSIPSIEGRQVWINKNKIWSRTKDLKQFDEMVEAQDIAIGMPSDFVRRSWGEPTNIETSGNPIYKNERWEYLKQVATPQGYKQEVRSVYFEGGKVTGWETE